MEDGINDDDRPEDFVNGEIKNENPIIFRYIASNAWEFIQLYGWIIIIIIALVYYLKSKIKFPQRTDPDIESKKYDNEEVRQKHEAMEEARMKMQERYAAQAGLHRQQQAQKEEEKRQERIKDWERHQTGMGYRSKFKPQPEPGKENVNTLNKAKKKVYKPEDYSPLMGAPSGSTYRPTARRTGGG